jgi:tripartite-type tricarboxylate transporter receptor subunit TctC
MTFARFAAPAIAGLILAAPAVALAQAQDYPTRPVTLVAPWPAGGAIDTLCRILGPKLSDRLGKPVIIENRAGAATRSSAGQAISQRRGRQLRRPQGSTGKWVSNVLLISITFSLVKPPPAASSEIALR